MDCTCISLVLSCVLVTVRSQFYNYEAYDYCDPKLKLCEVPSEHTMCKYPVPGLSPQCTESVHEPLGPSEKDRILYWHNKFRSYVANGTEKTKSKRLPTSSNMRQMYWDGELEAMAVRWAEQCASTTSATVYDKCRNTKRFQVSQNVGTRQVNGTTIEKQAPQIVITWYKENKDFDPALVDKFVPSDNEKTSVNQFANIIWANTYLLGCARVIFQEKLPLAEKETRTSVWTTERLVCNYGPGGNEIGKPIYKRGAPCRNCPSGTECTRNFPGLCSLQNMTRTKDVSGGSEGRKSQGLEKDNSGGQEEEKQGTAGSEEGDEESVEGRCEGEECSGKGPDKPRFRPEDLMRFPRPAARKKFREAGLLVPGREDDINIEKWKWAVSSGRIRRDDPENSLKNGDKCKCFTLLEDSGSGSSQINPNPFILIFSSYMAAEIFLLSAFYYKI